MPFHIGDKVRAIKDCSGAKEGKIYTVIPGYLKLEGTGCCCEVWKLVEKAEIAEAEKQK